MEKVSSNQDYILPPMIEIYKLVEENHRFYVSKRFTIISLYYPVMTIFFTGIYALTGSLYQILICVFGLILTLFLYSLENRNWILSNICLHYSNEIGKKVDNENNLHSRFINSYKSPLPEGSTFLDKFIRKMAISQHRAVSRLTMFLLIYWVILAIISIISYVSYYVCK